MTDAPQLTVIENENYDLISDFCKLMERTWRFSPESLLITMNSEEATTTIQRDGKYKPFLTLNQNMAVLLSRLLAKLVDIEEGSKPATKGTLSNDKISLPLGVEKLSLEWHKATEDQYLLLIEFHKSEVTTDLPLQAKRTQRLVDLYEVTSGQA